MCPGVLISVFPGYHIANTHNMLVGLALLNILGVESSDYSDENLPLLYCALACLVHAHVHVHKTGQTSYAYSLLMRANKLKTAAVQGLLACLDPVHVHD